MQTFGQRCAVVAAPDHSPILFLIARAEVEVVRRFENDRKRPVFEAERGVKVLEAFLAWDKDRGVGPFFCDPPHRLAHQSGGQAPAPVVGVGRHAVDVGRAPQLAFERDQVQHGRQTAVLFGCEHPLAAVMADQEGVDEGFFVSEALYPEPFAGELVGGEAEGRIFLLEECRMVGELGLP